MKKQHLVYLVLFCTMLISVRAFDKKQVIVGWGTHGARDEQVYGIWDSSTGRNATFKTCNDLLQFAYRKNYILKAAYSYTDNSAGVGNNANETFIFEY